MRGLVDDMAQIRWTKQQRQRLSKAVGKYNAKLTRALKQNPELKDYLPARKSVADLRASIQTASDLKREEREIERLFRKGALTPVETTKGVKTTKYEIDRIKRLTDRVNRQRVKDLENVPEDAAYRGVLGAARRNELRPKVFNPDVLTTNGWDKFVELVEHQASPRYKANKMAQYKQNYLKAIENEFGDAGARSGFYQFMENLPDEVIYNGFYEAAQLDLQAIYGVKEIYERIDYIWSRWLRYLDKLGIKVKNDLMPHYIEVEGGVVDTTTGEFIEDDSTEEDIFDMDWGR